MKIAVFLYAFIKPLNRTDQWVSARCEGRSAINQAYGFALLGHEVDLIGLPDKKNVFHGLSFVQTYDPNKYYDIIHVGIPRGNPCGNYGRMLRLIEPSNAIEFLREWKDFFPRLEMYTLSSKGVTNLAAEGLSGVKYIPCLFPIPCLPGIETQGFLPFKLDIKKEKIKIWAFINCWKSYHLLCDKAILDILRRLRDHHKLSLDVTLMSVSKESTYNTIPVEMGIMRSEFGAKVIYSNEMCYLDVVNSIMESDICITKGGFCYCGNCNFDIISLGKLMFYITELSPNTLDPNLMKHNINDLFALDEFVIRNFDTTSVLNSKVDKIMSNPEACYNAMKKELITYSFPEWKKIVTEVLSGE